MPLTSLPLLLFLSYSVHPDCTSTSPSTSPHDHPTFFRVLTLFCPVTSRRRRQTRTFSYGLFHSPSRYLSLCFYLFGYISQLLWLPMLPLTSLVDRKLMRFFDAGKSLIGNRPFCGRNTRRRKSPLSSFGMSVIFADSRDKKVIGQVLSSWSFFHGSPLLSPNMLTQSRWVRWKEIQIGSELAHYDRCAAVNSENYFSYERSCYLVAYFLRCQVVISISRWAVVYSNPNIDKSTCRRGNDAFQRFELQAEIKYKITLQC